jgi:hypothetical protein
VDLGSIPSSGGVTGLHVKKEKGFHKRNKVGVDKGRKEADVDTITATALLSELGRDFNNDLLRREKYLPDIRWQVDLGEVRNRGYRSSRVAALEKLEVLGYSINYI